MNAVETHHQGMGAFPVSLTPTSRSTPSVIVGWAKAAGATSIGTVHGPPCPRGGAGVGTAGRRGAFMDAMWPPLPTLRTSLGLRLRFLEKRGRHDVPLLLELDELAAAVPVGDGPGHEPSPRPVALFQLHGGAPRLGQVVVPAAFRIPSYQVHEAAPQAVSS